MGDGYYYDPGRGAEPGSVFYHFTEVSYYVYFPSIKNSFAGLIDCYEHGIYSETAEGPRVDDAAETMLWLKYGTPNQ